MTNIAKNFPARSVCTFYSFYYKVLNDVLHAKLYGGFAFLSIAMPCLTSELLSRVPDQTGARPFLLDRRVALNCRFSIVSMLWEQRQTSLPGKLARASMGALVHLP